MWLHLQQIICLRAKSCQEKAAAGKTSSASPNLRQSFRFQFIYGSKLASTENSELAMMILPKKVADVQPENEVFSQLQ